MARHGSIGIPKGETRFRRVKRQDTGRAKKRKSVGRAPTTRAGKRQDTVAGRATRRRNVATTPVTRPVARSPGGFGPGNIRQSTGGRTIPARQVRPTGRTIPSRQVRPTTTNTKRRRR